MIQIDVRDMGALNFEYTFDNSNATVYNSDSTIFYNSNEQENEEETEICICESKQDLRNLIKALQIIHNNL